MESLISFSIIMLMLSFVTERLANLAKLYYNGREIYMFSPFVKKLLLKTKIEILSKRQPTAYAEKQREYRIMIINIIVGIIMATVLNASFFDIIKSINEGYSDIIIGWEHLLDDWHAGYVVFLIIYHVFLIWSISLVLFVRLEEISIPKSQKKKASYPLFLLLVIGLLFLFIGVICECNELRGIIEKSAGYIITGLFLSLGSKFWHDVLDLLFKIKNVRRTLNTKSTFTDYDSADDILRLADVSHYEVAQELFEKYKDEIWNNGKQLDEGVLSVGLISELDERLHSYNRLIEVEFTTQETQERLLQLAKESSIMINYNTFYLKDYIKLTHTADIEAAIPEDLDSTKPKLVGLIKNNTPICYAYNKAAPKNLGSFSVKREGNKFYAESNAHVMLTKGDLKAIYNDANYVIPKERRTVVFCIDGGSDYEGEIIDYSFTNGLKRKDYCLCEIDKALYDLYVDKIKPIKHYNSYLDDKYLAMFGAASKYVLFKPMEKDSLTLCRINYGLGKRVELHLIKLQRTTGNINFGDSGSKVFYWKKQNGEIVTRQAIVVAKSSKYTYVFNI